MAEQIDLWKVVKKHIETVTENELKKVVLKKIDTLLQRVSAISSDVNCVDADNWTLVTYASYFNNAELIQKLIDNGADINLTDKHGWTPLMYAVQDANIDVIQILFQQNAIIIDNDSIDGWNVKSLAERFPNATVLSIVNKF